MRRMSKSLLWGLCAVALLMALSVSVWHPWLRSALGAPDTAPVLVN